MKRVRFFKFFRQAVTILIVHLVVIYFGVAAVAAIKLTDPVRNFCPERNPGYYHLSYQDVRFPARGDGTEIASWFIPNSKSSNVVILVHGRYASRTSAFAGTFVQLAEALHKAGFNVFMMDLRGHGQSGDGRISFGYYERRDVLGAVDWLADYGFPPDKIGILGISMGGAAGIGAMVEENSIGALILDSTFSDMNQTIDHQWKIFTGLPELFINPTVFFIRIFYGYNVRNVSPVEEISRLPPRPILIIHCKTDQRILSWHAERLAEAAPNSELWMIDQCEHAQTYNVDKSEYEQRVVDFLVTNLK